MKRPQELVRRIHEFIEFDAPPIRITVFIADVVSRLGVAHSDDAIELAHRWRNSFVRQLRQRLFEESTNAQVSCCEFCPTSDDYIQGSCYVAPNLEAQHADERRLRSYRSHYIEAFKLLSNTDFEHLCARVLSLWKVEKCFVSRRSADQGVDFFGRVPFGEILKTSAIGNGAEKQLKVWLVGQAKHYTSTQVSTKDIRELVGSVNLARSKVYAGVVDPLAQLEMRLCDPVFYLFFTTGSISSDARNLTCPPEVPSL